MVKKCGNPDNAMVNPSKWSFHVHFVTSTSFGSSFDPNKSWTLFSIKPFAQTPYSNMPGPVQPPLGKYTSAVVVHFEHNPPRFSFFCLCAWLSLSWCLLVFVQGMSLWPLLSHRLPPQCPCGRIVPSPPPNCVFWSTPRSWRSRRTRTLWVDRSAPQICLSRELRE